MALWCTDKRLNLPIHPDPAFRLSKSNPISGSHFNNQHSRTLYNIDASYKSSIPQLFHLINTTREISSQSLHRISRAIGVEIHPGFTLNQVNNRGRRLLPHLGPSPNRADARTRCTGPPLELTRVTRKRRSGEQQYLQDISAYLIQPVISKVNDSCP